MNLNTRWFRTFPMAVSLSILNLTGLTIEVLRRGDTPIHFYYESIGFTTLFLLNLPAIAIADFLFVPVNSLIKSQFAFNLALPFIIFVSLQWVLVSALIARICKRK